MLRINQFYRTKTIIDNGFNPFFENFKCEFSFHCPELAFVIFQVWDFDKVGSKTKLGWYSIPVQCIRQGYRIIPLKNDSLEIIQSSSLFCFSNNKRL